eukprot:gene10626-11751_t
MTGPKEIESRHRIRKNNLARNTSIGALKYLQFTTFWKLAVSLAFFEYSAEGSTSIRRTEVFIKRQVMASSLDPSKDVVDNVHEEEYDIYGDLHVGSLNDMNYNELKDKYENSEAELKSLRQSNDRLRRENEILKKNILSLYMTAKKEIDRKNNQIKSLQKVEMDLKLRTDRRR